MVRASFCHQPERPGGLPNERTVLGIGMVCGEVPILPLVGRT